MKQKDLFNSLFIVCYPIVIAIILWIFLSFKTCLLFYGLFTLGMYVHMTICTFFNVLNGSISRDTLSLDTFWKMLHLTISILCLTIFYAI